MLTQKRLVTPFGRGAMIALVSALALTAVVPTEASARARRWHAGGGAAAAAAFAGVVGTGLAIAATQNRGAYYDSYDGYYGGGPVYAAPQAGYYGAGYGYYGDPSSGPGPHGYGTTVPYVNGHPIASW
jgi:hypothetical protein